MFTYLKVHLADQVFYGLKLFHSPTRTPLYASCMFSRAFRFKSFCKGILNLINFLFFTFCFRHCWRVKCIIIITLLVLFMLHNFLTGRIYYKNTKTLPDFNILTCLWDYTLLFIMCCFGSYLHTLHKFL